MNAAILPLDPRFLPNISSERSAYTLATVQHDSESDESSSLLSTSSSTSIAYGTTPMRPPHQTRRVIFNATLKMALIFVVSCIFLGGILWIALPTLDPEDRPLLHIPKSFADLQDLNYLLKKYRDIYPFRVVVCYVVTYLFLQAFSLPGSMYLSILGGAVWGVARALPLACACVATGATLCYFISAALGPALLSLPSFQSRLELWSSKISAQRANLIPFLIVLRIAPLPPHWVVNVVAPHVGIGIFGVTVIHTSIGGGLDEMTSAADFHLISWRNFLTLAAVVVGAMIPVGIRYVFAREAASAVDDDESRVVLDGNKQVQSSLTIPENDEEDIFGDDSGEDDDDGDVILEAGPSLVIKDNEPKTPHSHHRSTSASSSLEFTPTR
ncbi:oxalate transporter [Lactarius hatsudake]|nr:oxalate transporter [Lactarius hatsudake]